MYPSRLGSHDKEMWLNVMFPETLVIFRIMLNNNIFLMVIPFIVAIVGVRVGIGFWACEGMEWL